MTTLLQSLREFYLKYSTLVNMILLSLMFSMFMFNFFINFTINVITLFYLAYNSYLSLEKTYSSKDNKIEAFELSIIKWITYGSLLLLNFISGFISFLFPLGFYFLKIFLVIFIFSSDATIKYYYNNWIKYYIVANKTFLDSVNTALTSLVSYVKSSTTSSKGILTKTLQLDFFNNFIKKNISNSAVNEINNAYKEITDLLNQETE